MGTKNVLFITIAYREYIGEIKKSIVKCISPNVDMLIIDIKLPFFLLPLNVITGGRIYTLYSYLHQLISFKKFSKKKYDDIFVLVGRRLHPNIFYKFLKKSGNLDTRKILYLWDDVARISNFEQIKTYFDKVLSFDMNDCKSRNFEFLPLFYCNQYRYNGDLKTLDISCMGSEHSNRYQMLESIAGFCRKNNLTYYFYLYIAKFKLFKKFLKYGKNCISILSSREYDLNYTSDILKRSKCCIDIPYASQNGLTIRSLESIAAHTKLVTTNRNVKGYDFYDERNILVVENNNFEIPKEFIESTYKPIDHNIEEKYSIDSWIKEIFS